jgi:RNA polymerase sigma factor (sigma-70 family)
MSDTQDRESGSRVQKAPPRCSFCNKVPGDETPLIEGPITEGGHRAYICGDCVELCSMIIEQQRKRAAAGEPADEGPINEVTQRMLREKVDEVLGVLSAREREIIKLRYGLADGHTYTLDEVGRMFDLTREQVREIEEACAVAILQYRGSPPAPGGMTPPRGEDHL